MENEKELFETQADLNGINKAESNDDIVQKNRKRVDENEQNDTEQKKKLTPEEAYQKIQSERDMALDKINKMQKDLEVYQQWTPALRMLQDNPDILNNLMTPNNGKSTVNVQDKQESLAKPVRPVKPKNYSRYEAVNDPESESAKYLDAIDDYNLAMEDYREKVENYRIQEYQERVQMQAAEREQQAYMAEIHNKLINEFKYTPEKANQFLIEMSRPNPKLEELVQLFEIKNRIKTNEPLLTKEQIAEKAKYLKEKQAKSQNFALPPTGGIQSENFNPEASFNDSLKNNRQVSKEIFKTIT